MLTRGQKQLGFSGAKILGFWVHERLGFGAKSVLLCAELRHEDVDFMFQV